MFRAPATEAIARFVGVETILDCRVLEGAGDAAILDAGGQRVEVAQPGVSGERVRLCLRAEDVTLFSGAPKASASPAFNRLAGRVQRMTPAGAHVRVTVDCGFPLVALMTRRSIEDMRLADGAAVTAHFKPTAPHLVRLPP